ncbi:MAG: type IV secretory system conjugative DNA transfer family protein [Arcobacteraceae bacterium]
MDDIKEYLIKSLTLGLLILLIATPMVYSLALYYRFNLLVYEISFHEHYEALKAVLNGTHDNKFMVLVKIAFYLPLGGFFRFNTLKGEFGSASFATYSMIKNKMKLFNKSGLFLGTYNGMFLCSQTSTSALVFAPPDTGKTSTYVMPNVLFNDCSFIIIDLKREIYEITAAYRQYKYKSKVYEFNPYSKTSMKFNPLCKTLLENLDFDKKVERLLNLSAILYANNKQNESLNHFQEEGKNLFICVGIYLLYKQGFTSIPEIFEFGHQDFEDLQPHIDFDELKKDPFLYFLQNEAREDIDAPLVFKEFVVALTKKADKEFSGVFSSFGSPLKKYVASSTIRENLRTNDLNILDLRKRNITLYITPTENQMQELQGLMNYFVEFNLRELMSTVPDKNDQFIFGQWDEFIRLGKNDYLIKSPSLSRAYKVVSSFIAQDQNQIVEVYGLPALKTLISSTAYKVIYPQVDYDTAEGIAKLIGDFTTEQKSDSNQKGELNKGNTSKSLRGQKLITTQDILTQDPNTIYINVKNFLKHPIKAKTYKYYEDKKLMREIDHANSLQQRN